MTSVSILRFGLDILTVFCSSQSLCRVGKVGLRVFRLACQPGAARLWMQSLETVCGASDLGVGQKADFDELAQRIAQQELDRRLPSGWVGSAPVRVLQ
jgi:hypothetical protein